MYRQCFNPRAKVASFIRPLRTLNSILNVWNFCESCTTHHASKGRIYFNMFLLHNSILRRTISYYTSGKHYAIAATPTSILSESLGEICLVAICHKKVEWDEDEINHRAFIAKWNYLLFPKNQPTFFSPGPIVILFVLGKTSSQQMHNSKSAELSGSMQNL